MHLTVHRGSGAWSQIEIERFQTAPPSKYRFLTSSDELDDINLNPDTLYRYRARFTHAPNDPWSHPDEQGKEAKTLIEAFNKGELFIEDNGWEEFTLVQRIEAGVLTASGNRVSITLRASSVGASIDRIYISQADMTAGMDPYDSATDQAAMHDILFKPPLVISPLQRVTIPAVDYPLDHTKPLLIAVDFSTTPGSGIMSRGVRPEEAVAYFKRQAPLQPGEQPEARKTDRTGYTRYPVSTTAGGIYLIERIDVG